MARLSSNWTVFALAGVLFYVATIQARQSPLQQDGAERWAYGELSEWRAADWESEEIVWYVDASFGSSGGGQAKSASKREAYKQLAEELAKGGRISTANLSVMPLLDLLGEQGWQVVQKDFRETRSGNRITELRAGKADGVSRIYSAPWTQWVLKRRLH